jgi:hypothetical protein
VPSALHEAPLLLLRQEPALVTALLENAIGLSIPEGSVARLADADFTQVIPLERRADAVVTLETPEGVLAAFVVEAQLSIDNEKRYTWPLYLASLHARMRCPSWLVVITPFEDVAAWAETPLESMQPTSPLTPIVLGPSQIPRITSAAAAQFIPEVTMLSALVHGAEPDGAPVIEAALRAASRLDEERMRTYFDLVYATLGEVARTALEALMPLGNYEYKSDFAKTYVAQGRAEGLQEGRAEGLQEGRAEGLQAGEAVGARAALFAVLAARGIDVSAEARHRIQSAADVALLKQWIASAAVADRIDDVFRESR